MRKTVTGTGGMLLLQTLKDAGVEYLFTNPGSAALLRDVPRLP
jgi:thiamine pyrophosphate-dependent acetolactate synthase large subunit-like protein